MSLRKCEKLMAPKTLKCVRAGAAAMSGAAAVKLFSITTYPTSKKLFCLVSFVDQSRAKRDGKLATSSAVLREWPDGSLRPLCLSPRSCISLGRAGVHRRDRVDRLLGRDLARPVRPAVATRADAAVS